MSKKRDFSKVLTRSEYEVLRELYQHESNENCDSFLDLDYFKSPRTLKSLESKGLIDFLTDRAGYKGVGLSSSFWANCDSYPLGSAIKKLGFRVRRS